MILIPPPPSVNPDLSLFLLNKQLRKESTERTVELVMHGLPRGSRELRGPGHGAGARGGPGRPGLTEGGGRLRTGKGISGWELAAASPSPGPV